MKAASTIFQKRFLILSLLAIISLGALLRFTKLDVQSLWNDELSSLNRINKTGLLQVIADSKNDVHPPLYYSLLYLWQNTFEKSACSARALSAFLGTLSILAIFFLGKELYAEKEGLISALIFSTSYFGIYYSQEARSYSLLLLLSICSYLFFIKALRQQSVSAPAAGRLLTAFMYVLFTALLMYAHYFGVLVFLSQSAYIFIRLLKARDKKTAAPLLYQACTAVLYIPQGIVLTSLADIKETWIERPDPDFLLYYFNEYWGRSEPFFILALFCIFWFVRLRKNVLAKEKAESTERPDSFFLLASWYCVPLAAAYARSIFSTPILTPRNTIIVLPALIVMMARGAAGFKHKDLTAALTSLLFIAGLCSLFITNDYYRKITKEQFRETAQVVLDNKKIADHSIIAACAWSPYYFDYFFEQSGAPYRVSGIYRSKEDVSALDTLVKESGKKYVWYLIGAKNPEPEFLEHLKSNYTVLGNSRFTGCGVFLLKVK
ncbi:MAG: glycosyltransferase family 39 protein [Pseudomonadota bacterium]